MLQSIKLVGLTLNIHAWTHLKRGIEETRILKSLSLNMIELDRERLQFLVEAMKQNLSIATLDLSFNDIKDKDGDLIAKIIHNQTSVRDM